MISIPPEPGVYAVEFTLSAAHSQRIGRLGEIRFQKGHYLYLGSALGPGGLRARLGRHLKCGGDSHHWHIDAFRSIARAVAFCYTIKTVLLSAVKSEPRQSTLECTWSQALASLPGFRDPVPGFGASDCRCGCRAHLVFFPANWGGTDIDTPALVRAEVQNALAESAGISSPRLTYVEI